MDTFTIQIVRCFLSEKLCISSNMLSDLLLLIKANIRMSEFWRLRNKTDKL